jgi:hypothetical protein
MAALPALVKALAAFDAFALFGIAAPMVIGMVLAVLGGILLTALGSVSAGEKSDDEKQKEIDGVVTKHNTEDLKNSVKDIVEEVAKAAGIPGLLKNLDDLEKDSVKDVGAYIDKLFSELDKDGNGVLEGDEYTKCIDELLGHLKRTSEAGLLKIISGKVEAGKEEAAFNREWSKINFKKLRSKIENIVDANNDGKISKTEAKKGFKEVVDYMDSMSSK